MLLLLLLFLLLFLPVSVYGMRQNEFFSMNITSIYSFFSVFAVARLEQECIFPTAASFDLFLAGLARVCCRTWQFITKLMLCASEHDLSAKLQFAFIHLGFRSFTFEFKLAKQIVDSILGNLIKFSFPLAIGKHEFTFGVPIQWLSYQCLCGGQGVGYKSIPSSILKMPSSNRLFESLEGLKNGYKKTILNNQNKLK